MIDLDRRLAELTHMSPSQLRAMWRDCWRKPAPDIGPDLLRRGIAWKLQSRIYGELPGHVARELDRVAARIRRGEDVVSSRGPSLKPGTRLVREWQGKVHRVLVLDDGFELDGRRFASLTQVATAITGTHWSGPNFFGLRKRPSVGRSAPA